MSDPIEAAARALYMARFPDAPVDEHFDWYRRYCDDKESGVHRSTVALAFRDARAAIDAYEAALWRPISSVPRDGAIVDLWVQSSFWNADGEKQIAVEFRVPDAIWFDGQWTNVDGNPHEQLEGFTNLEFTHWMKPSRPLPQPPRGER